MFDSFQNQSRQAAAWTASRLGGTSNPAMKAAMITFVVILAIPLLALGLIAVIAAVAVYVALRLVSRVGGLARNLGPRRDGRENVRVIQRP